MQNNILEYLEQTVQKVPDKTAFADQNHTITFEALHDGARAIGTFLYNEGLYKEPVLVFMERSPQAIVAFFGAIYGGNFYVPIDKEMPSSRIQLIIDKLNPKAMICDEGCKTLAEEFIFNGTVFDYEKIIGTTINQQLLLDVREQTLDTDPIYVVFTSGSTGMPKGVVACHRSVLDYIENLSDVLGFNEETIFGNQTPLYLDACLKEVYSTLKFGATTYIIPKSLFMFPIKLVEFLNQYEINTICWVVSGLTIISTLGVLEKMVPKYLHTIAFGSEVFPIKEFNKWKKALPEAKFTNLYGPTETTGMCCYYKVDRDFKDDEFIPIGRPFKNTEVMLLDENNNRVTKPGELGEMCVRGTSLTLGYYGDFDRTSEVFVQNPLNNIYPELIYRTGDLGKYNDNKELIFVSRKDYQIKHMGHRIELGEIEVNVNAIAEVQSCCCLYHKEKEKIVLFYVGEVDKKHITTYLKEKLPRYMVPNRIIQLETMPLTSNGKVNRQLLKEKMNEKRKREK